MPDIKEHLDAGFQASLLVVGLLLLAYTKGIVSSLDSLVRLSTLAVAGIVIGSDFPDIDAKSAPISKMFQILLPGTVVMVSLGPFGLWPPLAFILGGSTALSQQPDPEELRHVNHGYQEACAGAVSCFVLDKLTNQRHRCDGLIGHI